MNPVSSKEAGDIFNKTKQASMRFVKTEIVVCPPVVYLSELGHSMSKLAKLKLGAQDVSFFDSKGAHTGEVSARMLKNSGASYVIIGHSERRVNGETSETINKKIKIALSLKLKTIFCVGEEQRDRENVFLDFLKDQIVKGLSGVDWGLMNNLIVAYEPVWAISGKSAAQSAKPDDVFAMTVFIRKVLLNLIGNDWARKIRIIYGGSVDAENAGDFLTRAGVSGLLVGSKSLDKEEFGKILTIAEKIK